MQTNVKTDTMRGAPDHDVRLYFLQQGQSIGKLHDTLNSNLFVHHFTTWGFRLLEFGLYTLFAILVLFALWLPTQAGISLIMNDRHTLSFENKTLTDSATLLSVLLFIISLPLPAFAFLLGRNRKKHILIREAFNEIVKMKTAFDEAVRGWHYNFTKPIENQQKSGVKKYM